MKNVFKLCRKRDKNETKHKQRDKKNYTVSIIIFVPIA